MKLTSAQKIAVFNKVTKLKIDINKISWNDMVSMKITEVDIAVIKDLREAIKDGKEFDYLASEGEYRK